MGSCNPVRGSPPHKGMCGSPQQGTLRYQRSPNFGSVNSAVLYPVRFDKAYLGEKMARIGIDLDGVLYNFTHAFRRYLVEHCGWKAEDCPESTRWEFYEDWGIRLPEFLYLCRQAADAHKLWNCGGVWGGDDVVEALYQLQDDGHTLHVITHREFGSHKAVSAFQTAQWLHRCHVPYDTLTFSGDKTIVSTDWMIEDNVDNYLSLEASGCRSVLIDRPWNQDLSDARRVRTVQEFASLVAERVPA